MAMISTMTENGSVQVLPARTPGYYRIAHDAATKQVKGCIFHAGVTKSPWVLTGFDTWAEAQSFTAEHELTGLTAHDPAGGGD